MEQALENTTSDLQEQLAAAELARISSDAQRNEVMRLKSQLASAKKMCQAAATVIIGNSTHAADESLVRKITSMINEAFGYQRLSQEMVIDRLKAGDIQDNRVLHLAFFERELVGCVSSTRQPDFAELGCGHWGLLAVDPKVQGCGIGEKLVAEAELRLSGVCKFIQIDYNFIHGDVRSERLRDWYEGSCRFKRFHEEPIVQNGVKIGIFVKCRKPV